MRPSLDFVIGLVALAAAVATIAIWIPLDVNQGLTVRVRRQTGVGDALGPTVAAALLGVAGAALALRSARVGDAAATRQGVGGRDLAFLVSLVAILACAFALMRWAGPTLVSAAQALGADLADYRTLRGDRPWKLIGYILGGAALVGALISYAERRVTIRAVAIGAIAAAVLAAFYDGPFEDLLLPPNGDL